MDTPQQHAGAQWMTAYLAASSDNWAYVHGVVKFGDMFSDLARHAAEEAGLDDTAATYVSNMVARQQLPEGHPVALGTMRDGRPQIWMSAIDRNLVMSTVVDALRAREFVRPVL